MYVCIEKSIVRQLRYYIVHWKYSQPYVFDRAIENGLPRDVNPFFAVWELRARDHIRAPLIKVKKEKKREKKSDREDQRVIIRRP